MNGRALALFQFHKGAIRTYYNIYQLRHIKFQFHKGAIRTGLRNQFAAAQFYFNSIKVRLEPVKAVTDKIFYEAFQFHKGAIRTKHDGATAKTYNDFNSIKVRLELLSQYYPLGNSWNFNSIKVRLEHKGVADVGSICRYFNSIKVRLELPLSVHIITESLFQFHKGAIRTNHFDKQTGQSDISIP